MILASINHSCFTHFQQNFFCQKTTMTVFLLIVAVALHASLLEASLPSNCRYDMPDGYLQCFAPFPEPLALPNLKQVFRDFHQNDQLLANSITFQADLWLCKINSSLATSIDEAKSFAKGLIEFNPGAKATFIPCVAPTRPG